MGHSLRGELWLRIGLVLLLFASGGRSASSAQVLPTGDRFWEQLARTASVYWTEVPLREGLLRLGQSYGITVVLDRRCDPGQKVTQTMQEIPLRELLRVIARPLGYDVAFLPPIVYVGPGDTAAWLEVVSSQRREDLRKLGKVGLAGLRVGEASWPRLTTPRQLIVNWAAEAGWRVSNPDEILHDLWPEGKLPAMAVADRMTLVLFQFDQTFELSAQGEIRIVPLARGAHEVKRWTVGRDAVILAQKWSEQFPQCRFQVSGEELLAVGPRELLDQVAQAVSRGIPQPAEQRVQNASSQAGDPFQGRRFTVREGRGTLRWVIQHLGRQLNMEVVFDPEEATRAGIPLEQLIFFQVQDGTIDDLWKAVLEPHGLRFQRTGRTIRIYPASSRVSQ